MIKYADYIRRLEIKSLWSGHKHIVWELRPGVNVLSGGNGAGKSTILNRMEQELRTAPMSGEILGGKHLGVTIDFYPSDAPSIRYDIIRSFDRQLLQSDRLRTLTDAAVSTELDWQLYQLQRRYLDYQVNVGNRMIQLLTSGAPNAKEEATEASAYKTMFLDLVDDLFSETGKRIDRTSNELSFLQFGENLSPYKLSSGEKQMLIILLTALTQDRQPYVLFMDEPEASLHFEWQKRLIDMVLQLNPNVQIVLTTHSPAVVMNGWADCVTEMGEITM